MPGTTSYSPAEFLLNEGTPCSVSLQDVASNGVNGVFREDLLSMGNKGKEQCMQSEKLWD